MTYIDYGLFLMLCCVGPLMIVGAVLTGHAVYQYVVESMSSQPEQ